MKFDLDNLRIEPKSRTLILYNFELYYHLYPSALDRLPLLSRADYISFQILAGSFDFGGIGIQILNICAVRTIALVPNKTKEGEREIRLLYTSAF